MTQKFKSPIHILESTNKLIITPKTREWCKIPYPGHPKGCLEYGRRPECPPQASLIQDAFDLTKPNFLIAYEFDIQTWAANMSERHRNWSYRQCRCCLYWQGHIRKELRDSCEYLIQELFPDMTYHMTPEAMGLMVIRTARKLGLPILTKPQNIIYKIAFMGYPSQNHTQTQSPSEIKKEILQDYQRRYRQRPRNKIKARNYQKTIKLHPQDSILNIYPKLKNYTESYRKILISLMNKYNLTLEEARALNTLRKDIEKMSVRDIENIERDLKKEEPDPKFREIVLDGILDRKKNSIDGRRKIT